MRLYRFYVAQEIRSGAGIQIESAELVNQIRNVFRLKKGDTIVLFNGTGFDYECKIDGFGEGNKIKSDSIIHLTVASAGRSRSMPLRKLYLCAALVKKDSFEWIVQKAAELGVTDVVPVSAVHSEKKALNEHRLEKVATEASEQSGRGDLPVIHEIMGLGDAVAFLKQKNAAVLAFHTGGERFEHGNVEPNEPLGIFIGPEGGWSPDELDLFHKNEVPVVCLGPQVLRAETAVVATLSQVVFG